MDYRERIWYSKWSGKGSAEWFISLKIESRAEWCFVVWLHFSAFKMDSILWIVLHRIQYAYKFHLCKLTSTFWQCILNSAKLRNEPEETPNRPRKHFGSNWHSNKWIVNINVLPVIQTWEKKILFGWCSVCCYCTTHTHTRIQLTAW